MLRLIKIKTVIMLIFIIAIFDISPCLSQLTLTKHIGKITKPLLEATGIKKATRTSISNLIDTELVLAPSVSALMGLKGAVRADRKAKFEGGMFEVKYFQCEGKFQGALELFNLGIKTDYNPDLLTFRENERIARESIQKILAIGLDTKSPDELLPLYAAVIHNLLIPANWISVMAKGRRILGNEIESVATVMYLADKVTRSASYPDNDAYSLILHLNGRLKESVEKNMTIPGAEITYRDSLQMTFNSISKTMFFLYDYHGMIKRPPDLRNLEYFANSFFDLAYRVGLIDISELNVYKRMGWQRWYRENEKTVKALIIFTDKIHDLPLFSQERKF